MSESLSWAQNLRGSKHGVFRVFPRQLQILAFKQPPVPPVVTFCKTVLQCRNQHGFATVQLATRVPISRCLRGLLPSAPGLQQERPD